MKRCFHRGIILMLACGPGLARAQQTPSAAQIIEALKPGSDLGMAAKTAPQAVVPQSAAPKPAAPKPAAPTPAAPQPAAPKSAAPSINLNIRFAPNSARLTPEATRALDQLGAALTSPALAQYRFSIVGHTDTVGSPAANQALSVARANAVATYLETKFGVAASRLEASGVGEADLLVPTPPQTPKGSNRRVQVINLGS